ncbi:MAG: diaminobutyrate acetyltransferase [Vibrio sp.]
MNSSIAQTELYQEQSKQGMFQLRQPNIHDGLRVYHLIENCPPLDTNSSYCNFLQTAHFASTSVIAEVESAVLNKVSDPDVAGFISGYRKPDSNTLFIWQVAVGEDYRGFGLAFQMLESLLSRSHLSDIQQVETTITKDNLGSWQLFRKLARTYGHPDKAPSTDVFLDTDAHFNGEHDTEYVFQIPLCQTKLAQLKAK